MDREIKQIKDAVYFLIRINNQFISDEIKEKYDEKLTEIIKSDFDFDSVDLRVFKISDPVRDIELQVQPIVVKYFAMIQDNMEVKDKLDEAGYHFYGPDSRIYLFALDKQFTSKFDKQEYADFMVEQSNIAYRFYDSLRFLDDDEKDKYISDFAEIIHHDPNTARYLNKRENGYNTYNGLLTLRNLRCFGKDFLMNATNEQKAAIDSIYFRLEDNHMTKLKQLLEEYPHTRFNIELRDVVLDNFTIDEIANMSLKDANLYDLAIRHGVLDKMKDVLKINPDFNCPDKFVRIEIFRAMNASTIANLTDVGIEEICNIKIPRSERAFVIPVQKINRAVARDDKRKRKMDDDNKRHWFRF